MPLRCLVLLVVLAGCSQPQTGNNPIVLAYLEGTLWLPSPEGLVVCAYESLGDDPEAGERYVWARCDEFTIQAELLGGTSAPLVLTFVDGMLESHEAPRDGSAYTEDLARLFPPEARAKIGDARAQTRRAERLGEVIAARVAERSGL